MPDRVARELFQREGLASTAIEVIEFPWSLEWGAGVCRADL